MLHESGGKRKARKERLFSICHLDGLDVRLDRGTCPLCAEREWGQVPISKRAAAVEIANEKCQMTNGKWSGVPYRLICLLPDEGRHIQIFHSLCTRLLSRKFIRRPRRIPRWRANGHGRTGGNRGRRHFTADPGRN